MRRTCPYALATCGSTVFSPSTGRGYTSYSRPRSGSLDHLFNLPGGGVVRVSTHWPVEVGTSAQRIWACSESPMGHRVVEKSQMCNVRQLRVELSAATCANSLERVPWHDRIPRTTSRISPTKSIIIIMLSHLFDTGYNIHNMWINWLWHLGGLDSDYDRYLSHQLNFTAWSCTSVLGGEDHQALWDLSVHVR